MNSPSKTTAPAPVASASAASRWIWLSIAAAIVTISLKSYAAYVSQSVGLLSDAMESCVNLVAAVVTMLALKWSEAPPDAEHPFGHAKGELLAALLEGALVFVAGFAIMATSVLRFLHPAPIEHATLGVVVSLVATVVNGAVGVTLLRVGKRIRSSALEADGEHLLSDVWSSIAVTIGVGLAVLTGRSWFDPLSAILIAVLVLRTGYRIVKRATSGLVDEGLGPEEAAALERALAPFRTGGVSFSAVRSRHAGKHAFVNLIMHVPGEWSVHQAHELADRVEIEIAKELEHASVDIHVEPLQTTAR
jgi:cation diffusion facilitator family transporter